MWTLTGILKNFWQKKKAIQAKRRKIMGQHGRRRACPVRGLRLWQLQEKGLCLPFPLGEGLAVMLCFLRKENAEYWPGDYFCWLLLAPWVWGPPWGEEVLLRAFKATLSNREHGPGHLGETEALSTWTSSHPPSSAWGREGPGLSVEQGKEKREGETERNRGREEGREQERLDSELSMHSVALKY